MKFKLKHCKRADVEHEKNKRQYCHTYHYSWTICYSEAIQLLPDNYYFAIILHEIGHLLIDKQHTEKQADRIIFDKFGIEIKRKSTKQYGKNLEWIKTEDIPKALKVLGIYLK